MKLQDFDIIQGDTAVINITVYDANGDLADLTGLTDAGVSFMLYQDQTLLLTKTIGSGITISTPTSGVAEVKLSALDTGRLLGDYSYKLVITTVTGDTFTVASGSIICVSSLPNKGYCTVTDIINMTGTTLDDEIIQDFISGAKREIDSYLAPYKLSGSSALREAAIALTIARVFTRYRMDGTKPASLSIGGLSMSDNIDQAISQLRGQAWKIVDDYVSEQSSTRLVKKWVKI